MFVLLCKIIKFLCTDFICYLSFIFFSGYLKRNLKWGPWPKVLFGGMFGYMLGKYSYQAICAERLMQLPNSEIGRVLRERRGKSNGELFKG